MPNPDAIQRVTQFKGPSLAETLSALEARLRGRNAGGVAAVNGTLGVDRGLLADAAAVKRAGAQIDIAIHAAGILYALPHLLEEGESVARASLAAKEALGEFHLVTDRRLAQFRFVSWQDKGNAAREVSLFEDFYKLAEDPTKRRKYLYLLDTVLPLRFLQSGRDLEKVLKQNKPLESDFLKRYAHNYRTVGMYYASRRQAVQLVDLTRLIPDLGELLRDLPAGDPLAGE